MNEEIKRDLDGILNQLQQTLNLDEETLKVDLHCHDKNSDRPSESLGRILGIPETWLETDKLLQCLANNNTSAITITNHNNARSCWELIDRGLDILPGAEFSCKVPKSQLILHVLTYGFNQEQEVVLNRVRNNLYQFLQYCKENNLLTIWAHPLYMNIKDFSHKIISDLEGLVPLFSHIELINGQRDSRQNLVTYQWLQTFTPEKIESIIKRNGVEIGNYIDNPYKKFYVGGSDDHMGLFSGSTGTYVKVDNLQNRLLTEKKSDLLLEGLKKGNVAPYGFYTEGYKMSISFIDYFYMIVKHMKDPGLLRVLLHKGKESDKIIALLLSNGIEELRRHKFTLGFLTSFHNALHGKGPDFWQQAFVKKSARPLLDEIENIASSKKFSTFENVQKTKDSLFNLFTNLNKSALDKGRENLENFNLTINDPTVKLQSILNKIEFPANFRSFASDSENNIGKIFDKLSFPVLGSFIIGASNFISDKVLHDNREYLDYFSNEAGFPRNGKKMLWLTDTINDKNGIAISLESYRKEAIKRNLPIDFLACHETLESGEKLIITKPLSSFQFPLYKDQEIRIPNLMEIHEIFKNGNYDRVICSTEIMMGFIGLYLKKCFNIKAFFFVHTDWIEFATTTLGLSKEAINQLVRFSRTFYNSFDKLFVLNSDHKEWLSGKKMNIDKGKIDIFKHWVSDEFKPDLNKEFSLNGSKKLLYVGRLSKEKGLLDLPYIYDSIKNKYPDTELTIVGTGPLKEELKLKIPDAMFIDWMDHDKLSGIYAISDLMIFPSRFDTFGRVVLEAISCGCPVAAYNTMGPKDILEHMKSGLLSENKFQMVEQILSVFSSKNKMTMLSHGAIFRSKLFSKDKILTNLLLKTGLMDIDFIEESTKIYATEGSLG